MARKEMSPGKLQGGLELKVTMGQLFFFFFVETIRSFKNHSRHLIISAAHLPFSFEFTTHIQGIRSKHLKGLRK